MSDVVFHRTARPELSDVSGGELAIQVPPELPRQTPQPVFMRILPVVMLIAVAGSVAFMIQSGMARNPMALMFPIMMAVSTLGMLAGSFAGSNRVAETDELRKDYLRYLGQLRDTACETARVQREAALFRYPDPSELSGLVGTERMWGTRSGHQDFLTVRLGPGRQALATALKVPETGPVDDLEPVSVVSMRRFVRVHSVVEALPVSLDLRGFAVLSFEGPPETVRAGVRAMIAGLATTHGPDDLKVALAASEGDARQAWEWLKWLPHHQHGDFTDGGGRVRLTEFSLAGAEAMLDGEMSQRAGFSPSAPRAEGRPHLVVIVDGVGCSGEERILSENGLDGVTVLEVSGSRAGLLRDLAVRRGLCLSAEQGRVQVQTESGEEDLAAFDSLSEPEAERLAMAMARYRLAERVNSGDGSTVDRRSPGLPDLLGLGAAGAVQPEVAWRRRSNRDRLRVAVGVTPEGAPVELDLKEAAHGGMGPHGLCIGATGSGKSEFLRTLVLGLVATHDPDSLNLVLVDFKGGATFLGLEKLAHVSAVITNLQAEITMVDRMRDALEGELNRRQEKLRAAGNFANVGAYEAVRAKGADLDPMPALVIVVDEFSELLSSKPEFADLFLTIGRLGRSLHIHLLLASQRLEEGRLRGLDSHLSYRIALKTFSATESRTVLGVTDAYHLPSTPGAGFLKVDSGDPIRFDAAYVSGPYTADRRLDGSAVLATSRSKAIPRLFTAWYMPVDTPELPVHTAPSEPAASRAQGEDERSLLEVLVGRLAGHGRAAHEVWLAPLGGGKTLDSVTGREPSGDDIGAPADLRLPLAEVDLPFEQRRDVWQLDLSGGDGNVVIVGGTRSGKSTALRTLALAAAMSNAPDRLAIYCVDLGGGTLAQLESLPHVGGIAHRADIDRVRRTLAEVQAERKRRDEIFLAEGISSVEQARRRTIDKDGRQLAEFPDILLLIDGWQVFRSEFEDLEPLVTALASDGLACGIHVVITAARWADLRPSLRDSLGTSVELRLGDPSTSMVDRRIAMTIPASPGRGITPSRHHMLVLEPRFAASTDVEPARIDEAGEAGTDTDDLESATAEAARHIAVRWHARFGDVKAKTVRMLPDMVPYAEIASLARPGENGRRSRIPLGIREADLTVAYADFAVDPFLLIFGDTESGKTSVLRSIVRGLVNGNPNGAAKVVIADYRRTMLGEVEGECLAGYAATETALSPMVEHLTQILGARMPGAEITPAELRERSWWSGPEIYLVVDDLDLVITSTSNPLAPLVDFLPHSRDIGFHVVLARRSAGASRVLYDPFVGRIRDLGGAGILLSGSRDEGPLLGGVRPREYPPGRGQFVTRSGGAQLVHTAWCSP